MRKSSLVLALSFSIAAFTVNAQTFNAKMKPYTYEELSKPILQMQQIHEEREQYLDRLIDYVLNIKSHESTDMHLRKKMDEIYGLLKTYYDKPLANRDVYRELKGIELHVKEVLASYNQAKNDGNIINSIYFDACNLYEQEKYFEVIVAMNKILNINGNIKEAYQLRGMSHYARGTYKIAVDDFTKYLEFDNSPNVLFMRARSKGEVGDKTGALDDYDKLIKNKYLIDKELLSIIYNNKAYCYVEMLRYEEALDFVEKALDLSKEISFIWDTRGEIHYHLGLYERCIQDMDRAISITEGETSYDNSYYYRGLAKIKTGNEEEGIKDIQAAAKLNKREAVLFLQNKL